MASPSRDLPRSSSPRSPFARLPPSARLCRAGGRRAPSCCVRCGMNSTDAVFRYEFPNASRSAGGYAVLLPEADDFDLAREYLGHHQTGLRAGDALHLAIGANRRMEPIFPLPKPFLQPAN